MNLEQIGRVPTTGDNCAIATRILTAGTAVQTPSTTFNLSHNILEGHRFAIEPIATGEALLSWGMPFGRALRDIAPGEYVCNERVLNALSGRALDFELPAAPNFEDDLAVYQFDRQTFKPAPPLPHRPDPRTFMGYQRAGGRGVGTRNMIVLLGVNALAGGFVQQLENAVRPLASQYKNVDDIVAVAHTEGSQAGNNNQALLLRTLAGFMVHPNVAAVLVFDSAPVGVTNKMLHDYAQAHGYPLADVLHQFVSLRGPIAQDLAQATAVIKTWLPEVDQMERTPQPMSELKIALQCGGSDAFSGISGNPLAAWVSKQVIQAGGAAVLAETDELIGAEGYVLQKVKDAATAERFLAMVARFQERTAWHGHSAHGNPSGGNLYRGLYNIYLKSLGAATKRNPNVRLDGVLEYGELIPEAGYYFMDSPGNDLESIAGQVATGCNMIYFVTGNGSITNFPFVPTIKIVTTSARYNLLPNEMDINAGAYLDGTPMAKLGEETLALTLDVASGQPSVGEKAHHAQVQLWRNWQLTGRVNLTQRPAQKRLDGRPLVVQPPQEAAVFAFDAWQTDRGISSGRVGLILPSSLCSGQIAQMAAQKLTASKLGQEKQIARFASLVHTEGCGSSTQAEFVDTLLGYAAHPLVASCLILEHGCEITHNDFWRQRLREAGGEPAQFGWASVQLDGGIERVLNKMETWFTAACEQLDKPQRITADLSAVRIGLMSENGGQIAAATAVAYAQLVQQISAAGGTVVLPANDPLADESAFWQTLRMAERPSPTLGYAQQIKTAGFHLMETPTAQWSETMTGLGATGVELLVTLLQTRSQPAHPFIPVLQVADGTVEQQPFMADVDVLLTGKTSARLAQLLDYLAAGLSAGPTAVATSTQAVAFQVTRGALGVSL